MSYHTQSRRVQSDIRIRQRTSPSRSISSPLSVLVSASTRQTTPSTSIVENSPPSRRIVAWANPDAGCLDSGSFRSDTDARSLPLWQLDAALSDTTRGQKKRGTEQTRGIELIKSAERRDMATRAVTFLHEYIVFQNPFSQDWNNIGEEAWNKFCDKIDCDVAGRQSVPYHDDCYSYVCRCTATLICDNVDELNSL